MSDTYTHTVREHAVRQPGRGGTWLGDTFPRLASVTGCSQSASIKTLRSKCCTGEPIVDIVF